VKDENADAPGLDLVDVEKSSHLTSAVRAPPSGERVSRPTSQDERTPRHVRCDNVCSQIVKMASKVTFSSSPSLTFNSPIAPRSNHHQ
jgi:hypothetical protein